MAPRQPKGLYFFVPSPPRGLRVSRDAGSQLELDEASNTTRFPQREESLESGAKIPEFHGVRRAMDPRAYPRTKIPSQRWRICINNCVNHRSRVSWSEYDRPEEADPYQSIREPKFACLIERKLPVWRRRIRIVACVYRGSRVPKNHYRSERVDSHRSFCASYPARTIECKLPSREGGFAK